LLDIFIVINMPSVRADLNEREHKEALKARGSRTWREVLLEGLGVEETPRKLGRPRR